MSVLDYRRALLVVVVIFIFLLTGGSLYAEPPEVKSEVATRVLRHQVATVNAIKKLGDGSRLRSRYFGSKAARLEKKGVLAKLVNRPHKFKKSIGSLPSQLRNQNILQSINQSNLSNSLTPDIASLLDGLPQQMISDLANKPDEIKKFFDSIKNSLASGNWIDKGANTSCS